MDYGSFFIEIIKKLLGFPPVQAIAMFGVMEMIVIITFSLIGIKK